MIDVHIITSPEWMENMKIQMNILTQSDNVNVILSEPVDGDLFEARRLAYLKGTSEFVSFIDPDDQVLDFRIFNLAERILVRQPEISSVYSRWRSVHEKTKKQFILPFNDWKPQAHDSWASPVVHQIVIHRRENILKTYEALKDIKWGYLESWIVNAAQMQFGNLIQVDLIAYEWLLRENSARTYSKMNTSQDVLNLARVKLNEFKKIYRLRSNINSPS